MVPNSAIRNLIREGKVQQLYSQMQMGQDRHGMQTLNQALYTLFSRRMITMEEAVSRSLEVEELKMMIEQRSVVPMGQKKG
jgi:twitching motility protein PilT